MKPTHKLRMLLLPSWYSFVICFVIALTVVGLAAVMMTQHTNTFISSIFDRENLFAIKSVRGFYDSTHALVDSTLNSTTLNKGLFILFWALIGFITYNITYSFKNSVDGSVGFVKELSYVHARPQSMFRMMALRVTLITLALVLWLIYALVFSWTILPAVMGRLTAVFIDHMNPLYAVYAFILMLLYVHIAVILMRFTLLRSRLFVDPAAV